MNEEHLYNKFYYPGKVEQASCCIHSFYFHRNNLVCSGITGKSQELGLGKCIKAWVFVSFLCWVTHRHAWFAGWPFVGIVKPLGQHLIKSTFLYWCKRGASHSNNINVIVEKCGKLYPEEMLFCCIVICTLNKMFWPP